MFDNYYYRYCEYKINIVHLVGVIDCYRKNPVMYMHVAWLW